jgi:hypothetical protein
MSIVFMLFGPQRMSLSLESVTSASQHKTRSSFTEVTKLLINQFLFMHNIRLAIEQLLAFNFYFLLLYNYEIRYNAYACYYLTTAMSDYVMTYSYTSLLTLV